MKSRRCHCIGGIFVSILGRPGRCFVLCSRHGRRSLHLPPYPQLVYARTIETHTGFFVEVAFRAASVIGQGHVSRVARLHDAARVVRRQAVAGQGHVHHGNGHIARVLEDKVVSSQGTVRRDGAEIVQGVGEGDLCRLRVARLVRFLAMAAGGAGE